MKRHSSGWHKRLPRLRILVIGKVSNFHFLWSHACVDNVLPIDRRSQASVPHADVAIITAVVLPVTEIGGAVGNACAGAVWSNAMPVNLATYLPWLTDEQRTELYGSITLAASYPHGDPVRKGIINAHDNTMKIMVTAATVLSVVPVLLALAMPNWYLGDEQNAIDAADLTGRSVLDADDVEDEEDS